MRNLKSLATITFALAMVLLLGTSLNVQASSNIDEGKLIEEGYTEDGIKYTVHEIVSIETGISSRIAVSKKVTLVVTFDGKVTPQSYYSYNQYDSSYKIYMKGSLPRTFYEHIYLPFRWTTRTVYSGTVHGNI